MKNRGGGGHKLFRKVKIKTKRSTVCREHNLLWKSKKQKKKVYVIKLVSGRIQIWANQSLMSIERK